MEVAARPRIRRYLKWLVEWPHSDLAPPMTRDACYGCFAAGDGASNPASVRASSGGALPHVFAEG